MTADIDVRAEMIRKIESLKSEIKSYEAALQALDRRGLASRTGSEMRFYRTRPVDAMRIVLQETGRALPQEELTNVLLAGGAATGKKRGKHNIRISIEITLNTGKLKQLNGKIGMPEWDPEMFS